MRINHKVWAITSCLTLSAGMLLGCSFIFPVRFSGLVVDRECPELTLIYSQPEKAMVATIVVSQNGSFDETVRFHNIIPGEIIFKCASDTVGKAVIIAKTKETWSVRVIERQRQSERILRRDSLVLDSLEF